MNLQRKVSIELRSSESKSGRLKKCMGVLVGTIFWGEVQPKYTMFGVKKFPCMVSFSCGWDTLGKNERESRRNFMGIRKPRNCVAKPFGKSRIYLLFLFFFTHSEFTLLQYLSLQQVTKTICASIADYIFIVKFTQHVSVH